MSYGVNRAKKRPTRRKKRQSSNGRARAAGKGKSRATSTRRGTSARSARKKSAPKAARRKSRSTRKRTTSTRQKKQRLYTRYDPETGQKVRVTSDSYEYANWVSRKPSKKKQQRAALKSDPIGTLGTLGAKAAERSVEHAAKTVLTRGRSAIVTGAGTLAASGTAAALAAAGAVGAAIFAMGELAKANDNRLGERANKISLQFAATQKQVAARYGGRWDSVPADIRNKLVNGYKAAIAKVYSGVHTGVFAPSQQIPYGR